MGNLNNNQLSSVTVYDPNLWILLAHDQAYNIVRNSKTGLIAQAYNVPLDNSVAVTLTLQRYETRKQQISNFVKVYEVSRYENSYLCQGNPIFKVITERIPIRLSQTSNLSISQGLYIFNEALQGFSYLIQMKQIFSVNDDLIGFNEKGQVRLWFNQNFGTNSPNQTIEELKQNISQRENINNDFQLKIINEIYLAIEPHIQGKRFPKKFQDEFQNSKPHTIKQTSILIQNYIRREKVQKLKSIKNKPNSKFPTDLYTNLSQNMTPIKLQQIQPPSSLQNQSKAQIKTENKQILYNNQSLVPKINQKVQFIRPIQIPINQSLKTISTQQSLKTNPNFIKINQSNQQIRINKDIPIGQPFQLTLNKNLLGNQQINQIPQMQYRNNSFKVNPNPQTIINPNLLNSNKQVVIQINKPNNQILTKNTNNISINNNNLVNYMNTIPSLLQPPINTPIPIKVNQNIPVNNLSNRNHPSLTNLGNIIENKPQNEVKIIKKIEISNSNSQNNNQLLKNKAIINLQTSQNMLSVNNLKQHTPLVINKLTEIIKIDPLINIDNNQTNNFQNNIKMTQTAIKANIEQLTKDFKKAESTYVPLETSEITPSVGNLQKKNVSNQNHDNLSIHRTKSFSDQKEIIVQEKEVKESKQMTETQIQQIRNVLSEEVVNFIPQTIPQTHENSYKLPQNYYQQERKPYVVDFSKYNSEEYNLSPQNSKFDNNYQFKQQNDNQKYFERNYQTSYNYENSLKDVQHPTKNYQFQKYLNKNQVKGSIEIDQIPSYEQLRSLLQVYNNNNTKQISMNKDHAMGYLETYNNHFKYNF